MQILPVLNSQYHYYHYQVGEEHEYYLPMLILIVASIVLQVNNIQHIHLSPFWPQYCQYWHKKQLKKLGFVQSLTASLCPGVEWSCPGVDGASQS